MKKVEAVLSEVKRNYDSLKVQSDKTIKYRELREAIFDDEINIQLLKLRGFTQDQHNREIEVKKLEAERTEIQNNIDEINKKLSSNMDEVNEMESQLNDIQKRITQLQTLEKELARMVDLHCTHGRIEDCHIIQVLNDHVNCNAEDHAPIEKG